MMNLDTLQKSNVGLVLSGGGVKGIAHIGLLSALMERDIFPEHISGVSAGAIVGGLYADGVTIDDMLTFFKETPLLKYNFVTLNKPGLFDTDKYLPFFESFFSGSTFEDLDKSLTVVATNLLTGKPTYFNKGKLYLPLLASAALPPVFSPVTIEDQIYADGGLMNNFPVEPLQNNCDIIIGSYTTSMKTVTASNLKSSLQITQRANLLMLHANTVDKLCVPEFLFVPKGLETIGVLDKKGIGKAFNIGYDSANRELDKWIV